jgi:hypothetical protein
MSLHSTSTSRYSSINISLVNTDYMVVQLVMDVPAQLGLKAAALAF